jgi:hypothetical protein
MGVQCWLWTFFYTGLKKFVRALQKRSPNKNITFGITQLRLAKVMVRISPAYIYNIEKKYFNVIAQEIEILQPDIILFLSIELSTMYYKAI